MYTNLDCVHVFSDFIDRRVTEWLEAEETHGDLHRHIIIPPSP
jgi:hypothetical protein